MCICRYVYCEPRQVSASHGALPTQALPKHCQRVLLVCQCRLSLRALCISWALPSCLAPHGHLFKKTGRSWGCHRRQAPSIKCKIRNQPKNINKHTHLFKVGCGISFLDIFIGSVTVATSGHLWTFYRCSIGTVYHVIWIIVSKCN